MNNLVILLAGMKADLMLHHNVVHMRSLQNTLAGEESYLDALDLIQGGQESKVDDDPIGVLDGTILNDLHPHLKELSIRTLNNPAETKHLKKISEQKIKELKASIQLWELLESSITDLKRNNGNGNGNGGGGGGGAGGAAGATGIVT
jgi:hypothetical protein